MLPLFKLNLVNFLLVTNCIVVGFIYLNMLFNMIGGSILVIHVTPPSGGTPHGGFWGCDKKSHQSFRKLC
ncbi:hypothetical protein HanPSC8_Chr04g0151511 [Helianthus annuus]|nr:hypothetical protein HanPSC8_Chr04g0151511 [Helianthus annuus]